MKDIMLAALSLLFAYGLAADDLFRKKTPKVSHTLYCEFCRKQKEHNVINNHIYQCPTCRRIIDLSHLRT